MKRFNQQLKKQAESIRLRAPERRDLRERLTSYIEYHPLPQTAGKKKSAKQPFTIAEPYRTFSFSNIHLRVFGMFALLLVVSVPIFAERTVPGDTLYPIKVRFNEEVRSTLAFSPYEKVEWETERLSRRLAEARLLQNEGKLTQEAEAEVAEAVREHSDAAQEGIASLRESDAEEAAIAEIVFASALEVQSAVLKSDTLNSSTTETKNLLSTVVDEERAEADQIQSANETLPSIARLQARIEVETTRAYELLKSVRSYATEQESLDIERRLADIERKITLAQEVTEADEEKARTLLTEALQGTKKLISFMTDIDVRESIVIESLVPVEMTDDELQSGVSEKLLFVDKAVAAVIEGLTAESQPAVIDKVERGLTEIERLKQNIQLATESEEYASAFDSAIEAEIMAIDILSLLQVKPSIDEPTIDPVDDNASTTTEIEPDVETEGATSTEETTSSTTSVVNIASTSESQVQ